MYLWKTLIYTKKKWFSNNYKQLDKNNLEDALKYANVQTGLENAFKWGIRGAIAHDLYSDDEDDFIQFSKSPSKTQKFVNGLRVEKDGGMVVNLSQKEIDQYAKEGWIIEDV